MKKAIIFIFAAALTVGMFAAEVKIGVVNGNMILQNIEKGKQASKKLSDFVQQSQARDKALQDEIDRLTKELANPALSADTQQKKNADLQLKRTEMQRFREDTQNDFMQKQRLELEPIQKELLGIIQEIAKAEKYTLVIDISQNEQVPTNIIYIDETVDISLQVAKIYNERYPIGGAAAPAK